MTPGNVIVYNNWRVMHGRTSFTGNRRMVGCYMNYEDFQSKRQNLHSKRKATINTN
jgi:trimethyllysine dioxygenase